MRFCPYRCMGVFGVVRNVVVSACVLSAELWLESCLRVMVLVGVANVGCFGLPGAGVPCVVTLLWWLESFPWVMVLGGVANVGCVRLPGAGCSV